MDTRYSSGWKYHNNAQNRARDRVLFFFSCVGVYCAQGIFRTSRTLSDIKKENTFGKLSAEYISYTSSTSIVHFLYRKHSVKAFATGICQISGGTYVNILLPSSTSTFGLETVMFLYEFVTYTESLTTTTLFNTINIFLPEILSTSIQWVYSSLHRSWIHWAYSSVTHVASMGYSNRKTIFRFL